MEYCRKLTQVEVFFFDGDFSSLSQWANSVSSYENSIYRDVQGTVFMGNVNGDITIPPNVFIVYDKKHSFRVMEQNDFHEEYEPWEVLYEKLACNEYASWKCWVQELLDHSVHNDDGSITLPKQLVEEWRRKLKMEYKDLPEAERQIYRRMATVIIHTVSNGFIWMGESDGEDN